MTPVNDPTEPRIFKAGMHPNPWEETLSLDDGTPRRLEATCHIGGTPMHVTAVRVKLNEDGDFYPAHDEDEDEVDNLYRLYEGGPYRTTTIGGYEYLVYAIPYQH